MYGSAVIHQLSICDQSLGGFGAVNSRLKGPKHTHDSTSGNILLHQYTIFEAINDLYY